jgi:gas vesicle protein
MIVNYAYSNIKPIYMKGSQKFLAGVLIGAAAGAAIALFLKSEKGQELLAKAKECTNDWADQIKDKWNAFKEEQADGDAEAENNQTVTTA